jgi:asparagine synthetase B (glutamine-hydrolysing)
MSILPSHQCFFRVELSSTPSLHPFRDQFLTVSIQTNSTPILLSVSDSRGFLIWKSLSNRDKAENIYSLLLNTATLTFNTFSFVSEGFSFIFFDSQKQLLAFGKDRLGLSSLLWTEEPFIVSSHDLNGQEHPPGFTLLTSSSLTTFPSPPYQKVIPEDSIEVEIAMARITEILIRNVIPGIPILFSGGVDSTLMAAFLALSGTPEVVLLNFCAVDTAPDRIASRTSFEELKLAFPNTQFELREWTGNITEMSMKLPEIRSLLIPVESTEMNLNIAMTLYCSLGKSDTFAAHSGLGADELFCGYMRMRSDANVEEEVNEHINRLWQRNGGRDDRVCLHLGKQCVCPYLASEFIDYALKLPKELLIKPELPRGQGEKWILRQIALKYGLRSAANRPKQAMQFGSKVAKAKWRD